MRLQLQIGALVEFLDGERRVRSQLGASRTQKQMRQGMGQHSLGSGTAHQELLLVLDGASVAEEVDVAAVLLFELELPERAAL